MWRRVSRDKDWLRTPRLSPSVKRLIRFHFVIRNFNYYHASFFSADQSNDSCRMPMPHDKNLALTRPGSLRGGGLARSLVVACRTIVSAGVKLKALDGRAQSTVSGSPTVMIGTVGEHKPLLTIVAYRL